MQDFSKQQADWLKSWQESQETLTKQYAGWSREWLANISGARNKEPDFFEGWFTSQRGLEEQFREFSSRLNDMITTAWSGKVPPEVLKFMNISFFEEFYKNWLSTLELPGGVTNPLGLDGGWQHATTFLRSFLEKDHPFFSAFSSAKLGDQLSRLFGLLQGALGQEESAFGEIVSGYQDIFSKLFDATTAQSTEKLAEGFEAWAKEVEKQLSAPKLGINRELTHDLSQALVLSQNYVQAYRKMARLVEETSRKAGIRFQTKLSELALKNKPVTKFVDFCALWAVENETVFLEVMSTPDFAQLQGEFTDAGHRLKIQWNKLAEKALEPTPIALKRDLDLAIAAIHHLKRDLKTVQRELRDLGHAVQEARAAHAAAAVEANQARAVAAAAQEETKTAKAVAAAAQKEATQAKSAAATAQEETKQAKAAVKAAEAAAQAEVKQANAAVKAALKAAAQAEAKQAKAAAAEVAKRRKTAAPAAPVTSDSKTV